MLKFKLSKTLLVVALIISMLFPYGTPVIAATKSATYKQSDLTGQIVTMQNSILFPEGSSYIVDNPAGTTDRMLYKIYVKNDSGIDKTNAIYCLDEQKIFPGFDEDGNATTSNYKNMGNFYDASNTEVAKYIAQENIGTENYSAIVELTKIMYLLYQDDENKTEYNKFMNNVFGKYLEEVNKEFDEDQQETIENIKSKVGITFDDINVIEQCAVWYFSNKGVIVVTENENVNIYDAKGATSLSEVKVEYKLPTLKINNSSSISVNRKAALDMIFSYLVHSAKNPSPEKFGGLENQTEYPELKDTNAIAEIEGDNYKVGPFEISSSSANSSKYKITLTDGEKAIENYTIKTSDGTELKLEETVGKTFYVYIPVASNIKNVRLGIEYLTETTSASFWEKVDGDKVDYAYQPLVWITREPKEAKYKDVPIEESDLALRKYLVSKNGDSSIARTPVVDATGLLSEEKTASYKHKKSPLSVSIGDKLVYEIRVYNEGKTNATVKTVVDYIPEGLELVPEEESETNSKYKWSFENGKATIEVNKELSKIDEEKINSEKDTISGGLDNTFVQIELRVKEGLENSKVLTNIAEIYDDNITDRDSTTNSIDDNTVNNSETYTGHKDNKEDLSDENYHYKGSEDDDDFEKVKVEVEEKEKKFDLALKKFITEKNGEKVTGREPIVNVDPLRKGENNAKYTTSKSPLSVKKGDIVTYTIRVYNEGEIDGFALEVADYIPEGLGFLGNYKTNFENGWMIANIPPYLEQENSEYQIPETLKLTSIDNAINNLKVEDFVDVKSLDDVNVIKGKVKLITHNLNEKNKENMISKFNPDEDSLDHKDVKITCVVLADEIIDNNLRNIAEITDDAATYDNGETIEEVKDIDSTPDTVDPDNYPGDDENQDDNDIEVLIPEKEKEEVKFDLALMKFATAINGNKIDGREPTVDVEPLRNGKNDANYTLSKEPLVVKQGDIITYTIRVYNEGNMDGFAEEVADYIPSGLGYIVNYKANNDNYWSITDAVKSGAETVKLSTVKNALNNVKLSDFENVEKLEDVEVLKGKAKITSTALNSKISKKNMIEKFDSSKNTLSSKDIQVTCVVLADKVESNNLKNIAEVVDDSGTPDGGNTITDVEDIDSTPDTVDPDNYPGDDKNQDDNDYEDLTIPEIPEEVYDLALQKFITKVSGEEVKDRAPTVTVENGEIRYNHSSTPLPTGNGDVIEYTIRVFNEGKSDAYAAEVADDLPNGLVFIPDNETNKKYGWQLVDKNGKVTTDINQAVTVRTTYLSKEESEKRNEDNLLKAFDSSKAISTDSKNANPDYRDVKIAFRVDESKLEKTTTTDKRVIKNRAEITKETDKNGTPVIDIDSTPDNWKDDEDDIDKEEIYVKYFNLSLKKDLVKVIVIENGNTSEYNVSEDQLFKVEINKRKINSTVVKFVYKITVTNQGEIEGYAKEVKDYIPEGLEFISDENKGWYKLSNNVIATDALANTLLEPNGGSASVYVTLKWINGENNLNKKVNVAEISKDQNKYNSPDINSTPDNQAPDEDDIDNAPVLLSVSTGRDVNNTYYVLTTSIAVIMTTGIVLIKKFVLE